MNNSHLNYLNQITSDISLSFPYYEAGYVFTRVTVMVTYVKNLMCSVAGYIPDKRTTGMTFP